MVTMAIHPDDILVFREVTTAMEQVAKQYGLPLRKVEGLPMPKSGMANRLGDCSHSGTIRLVLRCTEDGEWCDAPMSPDEIWRTAAHELAHLRFMNHGLEFQKFEVEMNTAMNNRKQDHKAKILDKLVKMQKSRESEAQLGNAAAAEAFASAINRMLIEYELNPSAVDYARATDQDPVIELKVNWVQHMRPGDNPKMFQAGKRRIAWQETLARVVSKAHLCSFLIQTNSDTVWFVGTKSHATVAEYVYSTLVLAAFKMAKSETEDYKRRCQREGRPKDAEGFRESWLAAFIQRIDERFADARKAAVAEVAADIPGGTTQALMRLDGALVKVRKYIDNKFTGHRKYASQISGPSGYHAAGRAAGTAAADRMPMGRRGVDGATRKQIGGGS